MFAALETCPVGDTVLAGLEMWPGVSVLGDQVQKCDFCLSPVYDKMFSSKAIKHVLDALTDAVRLSIYDTA